MKRIGLFLLLAVMAVGLAGCSTGGGDDLERTGDTPTYGSLKIDGTLYNLEDSVAFCFRVYDRFLCGSDVKGGGPPMLSVVLPASVHTGSQYTTSNIDNLYVSWSVSGDADMLTVNNLGGELNLTVDKWPAHTGGEVLMHFSGTLVNFDGSSTRAMTDGVLHSYWNSAYDRKAAQDPTRSAWSAIAGKHLVLQRGPSGTSVGDHNR